ncbi:DUF6165 family protein [Brevundimonas sp.]|uniref:DUF6165 family protein n=1 Tax=Brevundimonas sp. TaxID=1871086 RepID=UPI00120C4A41|nr:DUF6165 family protein [Brevundimonas sp.]TAJ65242.1 MAG: glycosyltransferase family 41 protein [Brevundimonas sp.]
MMDDGEATKRGGAEPSADLDRARAACEAILRHRPDDYHALNQIGLLALRSGALREARGRFEAAVAIRPEIASGHRQLALTLLRLGRPHAALERIDRALEHTPRDARSLALRGRILGRLDRIEEAAGCYSQALAAVPGHPAWRNSLGGLLVRLRRFGEALACFDEAVALGPDHAEAHTNRGLVLAALGRADEAVASHDRALVLRPDFPDAQVNRAVALLSLERFAEGWRDLEARKRRARPVGVSPPGSPLWRGQENLAGRSLLVLSEQGLGDTIQFCRYLPLLEARGARVLFGPQDSLVRLMASLDCSARLVDARAPDLSPDFHAPLMSLPLAFGTSPDVIPAPVPYLKPEPARVAEWKARLGGHGFRIGVAWQGSRAAADAGRSFPVAAFAVIAAIPGVRLISLQKGHGAEQLRSLPPGMAVEDPGEGFDAGGQAFLDTAAVIEVCDLVITSDTAVAHLSGALARPTWVVLQHAPDWRWMREREDSPWYPTMRLFRQTSIDDWPSAFDAVETALRDVLNRAPAPHIPVGWGEIIDKLTILEIKQDRIPGAEALANVRRELAAIEAIAVPPLRASPELAARKDQLAAVNRTLWNIEDALRDKEAGQAFDEEFIALARAVYRYNDERALIKQAINRLLGSDIVEEKSYGSDAPGPPAPDPDSTARGEEPHG